MPFQNFEHLIYFLKSNNISFVVQYWLHPDDGRTVFDCVEIYTNRQDFVVYNRENEPKNKYFSEGFAVRSLHDFNLKSEILSCM